VFYILTNESGEHWVNLVYSQVLVNTPVCHNPSKLLLKASMSFSTSGIVCVQNCCICYEKAKSCMAEALTVSCCFLRNCTHNFVVSHFAMIASRLTCYKCWRVVRFGFGHSTYHSGSSASSLSRQYVVCLSHSLRSDSHVIYFEPRFMLKHFFALC